MVAAADDWRLIGQDQYLARVRLVRKAYAARSSATDHDHCEFCGAKFMNQAAPGILTEGYCTEDCYRWICADCFEDFKDQFGWLINDEAV